MLLLLGFCLGAAFLKFEFSFTASWRRFIARGDAGGLLSILILIAVLAVAVVPAVIAVVAVTVGIVVIAVMVIAVVGV
jgi:hypothetical protein